MLCYAPPQTSPPFLTEMAKEARTTWTRIQSPLAIAVATRSSYHQSETRMQ